MKHRLIKIILITLLMIVGATEAQARKKNVLFKGADRIKARMKKKSKALKRQRRKEFPSIFNENKNKVNRDNITGRMNKEMEEENRRIEDMQEERDELEEQLKSLESGGDCEDGG